MMPSGPNLRLVGPMVFWLAVVLGPSIPWVAFVGVRAADGGLAHALAELGQGFFEPGYNLFLVGVLNAVPFVLLAIATLLLLTEAVARQPGAARARVAGLVLGGIALTVLSVWGNLSILRSRSSTAAIGYLFLPFLGAGVLPVGYGIGWAVMRWAERPRVNTGSTP